jgi:hypothetical protein
VLLNVRPGDGGDVGQNLAAQAMTDLAEHASLGVRQLQPTVQLRLEDAVLSRQVLVPRQQRLVHRPRHVGRDTHPIHTEPHAPTLDDGVTGRPQNRTGPRLSTAMLTPAWALGFRPFARRRSR